MQSEGANLTIRTALVLWLGLIAGACGDLTDSVGEQGRLRFAVATRYEVDAGELRDATLVSGHAQRVDVELTNKGREDIAEPDEMVYRVEPDDAASVRAVATGGDHAPTLEITAEPGKYEIEALYKGKVIDAITLTFDAPDDIELAVELRAPYEADFTPVTRPGTLVIVEGTQATFLPIPKRGDERLVGRMETRVEATPKELVVPGEGASFVYEQSVWTAEGNVDFYFIDPGTVTVTITDPISGVSGSFAFEVGDA